MTIALMLGSAPNALEARDWPRAPFDHIVAINNAWAIRPDWTALCCPWDFPEGRRPRPGPGQRLVLQEDFVPAQNLYGGFVYAGGTMAFTTAYWMLAALKPAVIAVFGCDMTYPREGPTHFYGTGSPDPLRPDITLRSLEAKSARLQVLAALQGCAMVNLSPLPSRLIFPRARRSDLAQCLPAPIDRSALARAQALEQALDYHVPSGRYWEEVPRFDPARLDQLDALWLAAAGQGAGAASGITTKG